MFHRTIQLSISWCGSTTKDGKSWGSLITWEAQRESNYCCSKSHAADTQSQAAVIYVLSTQGWPAAFASTYFSSSLYISQVLLYHIALSFLPQYSRHFKISLATVFSPTVTFTWFSRDTDITYSAAERRQEGDGSALPGYSHTAPPCLMALPSAEWRITNLVPSQGQQQTAMLVHAEWLLFL